MTGHVKIRLLVLLSMCLCLPLGAQVSPYFDMKLLVEGQYATIHTPFVLHEGKVYFFGNNSEKKRRLFIKGNVYLLNSKLIATFAS